MISAWIAQRLVSPDERGRLWIQAGEAVWVEEGDQKQHPGIFVGEAESASWFGGAPCARVVDPETDEAEVVPICRITPRDE
jgi:hypothetical protein